MTVCVQVVVLLIAARLIFGIHWGGLFPVALTAAGIIFSASSFGIFVNSFLKNTKQAGVLFGGVLTVTGMVGMISIFAMGSPGAGPSRRYGLALGASGLGNPRPDAVHERGASKCCADQRPYMLAWSTAFFIIGVLRFNRRYV